MERSILARVMTGFSQLGRVHSNVPTSYARKACLEYEGCLQHMVVFLHTIRDVSQLKQVHFPAGG